VWAIVRSGHRAISYRALACNYRFRPRALCNGRRREDREIGVAARESIEAVLAIPDGCKLATSKLFLLAVVVAAVVMVMVPSGGHIEATLVPMPMPLTDPDFDATDPDFDVFRDDHWFVADA